MAADTTSTQLIGLLDFLAAREALEHPPVTDIDTYGGLRYRLGDVPVSPFVRLSPAGESDWLTVDFVDLPPAPDVPLDLMALLGTRSALSPHQAPIVREPIFENDDRSALAGNEPDANGGAIDADDEADPVRQRLVELIEQAHRWIDEVWRPWSDDYRHRDSVKAFHRSLFDVHGRLTTEGESFELVWGFGRLSWQPRGAGKVDHPIVLVPAEIRLDLRSHQLIVGPTESDLPSVATLFLAGITKRDEIGLASLAHSVAADEEFDPWSEASFFELARRYIRCLSDEGTVVESVPARSSDIPEISTEWTLYVRRREPDYLGFIRGMRELYEAGAEVPEAIRHVLGAPVAGPAHAGMSGGVAGPGRRELSSDELLLPLASNADQDRIVRLAHANPGVTVQGPPGTGKSHTIANLISHYVSLGQRVLIVAEKEQALKVLRDKVPDGIRALAVSVLGSGAESRRELEASIQTIQSRVGSLNPETEASAIAGMVHELETNGREIARTKNLLLTSRRAEINTLAGNWMAGESPTPSTAATWLASRASLAPIPDNLSPQTACPVSADEFSELLGLLRRLGVEQAREAVGLLPDPAFLPRASELAERFARLTELRAALAESPVPSGLTGVAKIDRPKLDPLVHDLTVFLGWHEAHANDWAAGIADQSLDSVLAGVWQQTIASIRQLRGTISEHSVELASHDVTLPDPLDPGLVDGLKDVARRIAEKGKLGLFDKDLKRVVESVQVDGRVPTSAEQVTTAARAAQRALQRAQLARLWNNHVGGVNGPVLGLAHPEAEMSPHLDILEQAVGRTAEWLRIRHEAGLLESSMGVTPSREAVTTALTTAVAVARHLDLQALETELATLEYELISDSTDSGASPLFGRLAEAVRERDVPAYTAHLARTGELAALAPDATRLWDLHTRLEAVAPRWAAEVAEDPDRGGDPGKLRAAWEARQLELWLAEVLELADPATLQRKLDRLGIERRRLIEEIVTARAWSRLAANLTHEHREALTVYVQAVKAFGKTGGKYRERKQRAIRSAFEHAKRATPVWIMTANEALRSSEPSDPPPFDVLIVDEASQLELRSLPLLALARRAIVVGDDQQTSPPVVGLNQEPVHVLISTHLAGIPNAEVLFAPGRSLYDVASAKFGEVVTLTEHFRCLPPIIEFSNRHFYDGAITPLRDRAPHPGWVPVASHFVTDGYRDGHVNHAEAEWILAKIAELCGDARYDGMTFGVISLLSGVSGKANQAQLIRDLIYDKLGPEVMSKRKIRVGTGPEFQGDERDVMFLSCVVAHDAESGIGRARAQTTTPFRQAMNVAASRARNQMWVVHSLPADAFAADDLRGSLIRHCATATVAEDTAKRLGDRCGSDFERAVLERILDRGFERVRVQYPVSRFSIDIVVESDSARLAIECDGDRWHGEDAWQRDCERQEILERAGWVFTRIRGSAFYFDPDTALEPLWKRLDELGIRPAGAAPIAPSAVLALSALASQTTATCTVPEAEAPPPPPPPPPRPQPSGSAVRTWAPPPMPQPAASPERTPTDAEPNPHTSVESELDWGDDEGFVDPPLQVARPQREWTLHRTSERPPVSASKDRLRPPSPSVPAAGRASITLAAYHVSEPGVFRSVVGSARSYVVRGLTEIVETEGPMIAEVAYRRYNRAAGGSKLGKVIKTELDAALLHAIRTGAIAQLDDDLVGQMAKTIYLPGTEPVVPRVLGPRSFLELPLSELKTVAQHLRIDTVWSAEWRRITHLYSLPRLTPAETSHLERALAYDWGV